MNRLVGIIALFLLADTTVLHADDTVMQLIFTSRVGVTVSPVRLYTDSVYAKATDIKYAEGELFEIQGETKFEHFDNTQNQTFKWYQVRNVATGQVGWIFGDNLAVVMPEHTVDLPLRSFYKKTLKFDNGFESAVSWVAGISGHDDKQRGNPFLNPPYKEYYLIFTNEQGKSVNINYANLNESGRKEIQSLYLQDVTNNKINDIIIETTSLETGKSTNERQVEVWTFKAGTLTKIFEERQTLTWEEDMPSPAMAKFVEVEGATLRVAYIDFVDCATSKVHTNTDSRSKTQERCLEYVTYSYVWDMGSRSFKTLYAESRSSISGYATQETILKATPSVSAANIALATPTDRLQIVKHTEVLTVEGGKKRNEVWLYVKHPSGSFGYLKGIQIQLKNVEHADILQKYYQATPLMKQDWETDTLFLTVLK